MSFLKDLKTRFLTKGKPMEPSWEEKALEKIQSPQNLLSLLKNLRKEKKTIATLNGSFDLLHAGHLHMIYEASKQADILVMALNTDDSIQKYKGKGRPIVPLLQRLQIMAALSFVDYVTYFSETDPIQLLDLIKPDVHVNGSEYGENCIEADIVRKNGGRIHIVRLKPGLSTSEIIKKIKR